MRDQKRKKIGIYVAHDDDAILSIGGKLIQHVQHKDDIYMVVFSDGSFAQKFNNIRTLNFDKSLSALKPEEKRHEEFFQSLKIIGIPLKRIYSLSLPDGRLIKHLSKKEIQEKVIEVTNKEKPDIIYFNFSEPGALLDHWAVSRLMKKIVAKLPWKLKAYQFFVWMRPWQKKAFGFSGKIAETDIKKYLDQKREAIFKMQSQINVWPYADWPVQKQAVLPKKVLKFFLSGREFLIEYLKDKA